MSELTDKELNNHEYMRAYVEELQDTIGQLLNTRTPQQPQPTNELKRYAPVLGGGLEEFQDGEFYKVNDVLNLLPASPIAQPAAVEGARFICADCFASLKPGHTCDCCESFGALEIVGISNFDSGLVGVDKSVIDWLLGESDHPEHGWFERPEGQGKYWWRDILRTAIKANPSAVVNSPSQAAIEASDKITMEGALKKAEKQLGMIGAVVAIPEGMSGGAVPNQASDYLLELGLAQNKMQEVLDIALDNRLERGDRLQRVVSVLHAFMVQPSTISAAQSQGDAK